MQTCSFDRCSPLPSLFFCLSLVICLMIASFVTGLGSINLSVSQLFFPRRFACIWRGFPSFALLLLLVHGKVVVADISIGTDFEVSHRLLGLFCFSIVSTRSRKPIDFLIAVNSFFRTLSSTSFGFSMCSHSFSVRSRYFIQIPNASFASL